jgi:hypothetical protein
MEVRQIVSLDNLASRYHMLPSQALESATTFDLYVMDVAVRYERHRHQVATGAKTDTKLSREQLQSMIDRVRK